MRFQRCVHQPPVLASTTSRGGGPHIAPEVLECGLYKTGPPYGKQADMWSAGVVVYVLLTGSPPFQVPLPTPHPLIYNPSNVLCFSVVIRGGGG